MLKPRNSSLNSIQVAYLNSVQLWERVKKSVPALLLSSALSIGAGFNLANAANTTKQPTTLEQKLEREVFSEGEKSIFYAQPKEDGTVDVALKNISEQYTPGFSVNLDQIQFGIVKDLWNSEGWQEFYDGINLSGKKDPRFLDLIKKTLNTKGMKFANPIEEALWLSELSLALTVQSSDSVNGPRHDPNSTRQTGLLSYLLKGIDNEATARVAGTIWAKEADGAYQWMELSFNGGTFILDSGYTTMREVNRNDPTNPEYGVVKARNPDGTLVDRTRDYTYVSPVSFDGLKPGEKYYLAALNFGIVKSIDNTVADSQGVIRFSPGNGNVLYAVTENEISWDTKEDPRLRNLFVLNGSNTTRLNLDNYETATTSNHDITIGDPRTNDSWSYFDKKNPENYEYKLYVLGRNGWRDSGILRYDRITNGFVVNMAPGYVYAISQGNKATTRPLMLEDGEVIER